MDDKFIIAISASGYAVLGMVVSSIVSFVLGMRSERQKVALSSAEYLRHKIQVLEKCRENPSADEKRFKLKKGKMHDAFARVAEESLDLGSSTITPNSTLFTFDHCRRITRRT